MNVSEKHRIVIATPSKCGTHSFKKFAKDHPDFFWINTMHLMEVPREYQSFHRILVVRHPYDRLVAVWDWIAGLNPNGTWGSKETHGWSFKKWVRWFAARKEQADLKPQNTRRAPHLWTNSLKQNNTIFDADEVIKIERIPKTICYPAGDAEVIPLQIGNYNSGRKAGRRPEGWLEMYDPETLAIAKFIWGEDLYEFGYKGVRL